MQIQPSDNPNQHQQLQQPIQTTQPIYQPIKFVYTQTIGSIDEKFRQIIDPYIWTYEDLLQPKIIYGKSKIEYYLFHIAPIYNWLRHVGSGMLAGYVGRGDDLKGKVNSNINNFNKNKNPSSSYTPFSLQTWKFEMKHYIAQWQIAKLCASAKIKILTTRVESQNNNNNNNKNNNKSNRFINSNLKQKATTTIIVSNTLYTFDQKDKFTTDYVLNNLDTQNKNDKNNNSLPKLQFTTIYCQQCQQQIKIKSQIIKYPFAPYFNKYHGKEFTIMTNQLQQTKVTYQLIIIYCSQKVYVRSSGGVWYEISFKENKKNIVSFEKVDNKAGLVFVYQQKVNTKQNKVLRKAQPVKVQQHKKQQKGLVDLAKFLTKQKNVNNGGDYDDSQQEQQVNKVNNNNNKQKVLQKPKPNAVAVGVVNKLQTAVIGNQINNNQPQTLQQQQQNIQQEQQNDDQPLQDMTKKPLPIVLNKKKTQRKLFKQYKKTVQSLLPKPKQKDQYQKQYDKGKTKKIHKNRQQFRTADFFQLYNKIKGNNNHNSVQQQQQQSNNKRDDNNENNIHNNQQTMRDENKRQRNSTNNNGDGDDDYNFVCQPRRGDRFRGGRGGRGNGRGGGRGGRFGDRDGGSRGGRDGGRGRGRGNGRGGRGGNGGFKSHSDKGRNNNNGGSHGNKTYHNKSNNNRYNNNNNAN